MILRYKITEISPTSCYCRANVLLLFFIIFISTRSSTNLFISISESPSSCCSYICLFELGNKSFFSFIQIVSIFVYHLVLKGLFCVSYSFEFLKHFALFFWSYFLYLNYLVRRKIFLLSVKWIKNAKEV